jgi:ketosteroid isomerase-like protein
VNDVADDEQKLLRLNLEMGEQELTGAASVAFFDELLDANFWFRRGNGSTVDKQGFLDGLADPGNRSDVLTTDVRQVQVLGDQAFVEAWVELEGTRGGKPVVGTFRNLRLFERAGDTWRCVMWFNKKVEQG